MVKPFYVLREFSDFWPAGLAFPIVIYPLHGRGKAPLGKIADGSITDLLVDMV